MQRLAPPWSKEASIRQRVAPILAALVIVAAVVYSLLPFTFAGRVECSGSLFGSRAAPDTPAGAIIGNPDVACADTGGRRRVNAIVVIVASLAIGLGGAFLPSDDQVEPKRSA